MGFDTIATVGAAGHTDARRVVYASYSSQSKLQLSVSKVQVGVGTV
jgi:hypothetical protein